MIFSSCFLYSCHPRTSHLPIARNFFHINQRENWFYHQTHTHTHARTDIHTRAHARILFWVPEKLLSKHHPTQGTGWHDTISFFLFFSWYISLIFFFLFSDLFGSLSEDLNNSDRNFQRNVRGQQFHWGWMFVGGLDFTDSASPTDLHAKWNLGSQADILRAERWVISIRWPVLDFPFC